MLSDLHNYLIVGETAGGVSLGVLVPEALVFFLAFMLLFFNLSARAASIASSAGGSVTGVLFVLAAAFAALASFSLFLCFAVVSAAEGFIATAAAVGGGGEIVSAAKTTVVNVASAMAVAVIVRILFMWVSSVN
jgi:hypothetical protein